MITSGDFLSEIKKDLKEIDNIKLKLLDGYFHVPFTLLEVDHLGVKFYQFFHREEGNTVIFDSGCNFAFFVLEDRHFVNIEEKTPLEKDRLTIDIFATITLIFEDYRSITFKDKPIEVVSQSTVRNCVSYKRYFVGNVFYSLIGTDCFPKIEIWK